MRTHLSQILQRARIVYEKRSFPGSVGGLTMVLTLQGNIDIFPGTSLNLCVNISVV